MKFSDIGFIIDCKKYSEKSLILKVFTQNHGIYRGFIASGTSKKNQAIFQVGNLISFEWRSRTEDSLGNFYYVDLIKSYLAKIIFDRLKLNCFSSLVSIIDSCFLERENQQELYFSFQNFLTKICESSEKNDFLSDYIKLELEILQALGFGIDLSSCAVTESLDNLVFVSPKSGRAVSFDAGKEYENKLLKLPQFLTSSNDNILEDNHIFDGLKLSGYFLEKYVFAAKNIKISSRNNIEKELKSY